MKFGKLEFTHKPLSVYLVLTLSDKELTIQNHLENFSEFVNDNSLSKKKISWQDLAKQGSANDFWDFVNAWHGGGNVKNA